MLKRRALRKIIITTFSLLTVFAICIIPNSLNSKDNFLDTKIDLEYVNNLGTNEIYLLGPNKYLVKTNVLLETDNINTKIRSILDYLTIQKSDKLPTGLSGIIPMNTKVNNVEIKESIVTIDFSKELLDVKEELEERLIEAITYSIINIDGVEAITIKVDGNLLTELPKTKKKLPELLNRNFGINKVFDIDNLNGIQKVTLYYLDKISNQNYYVSLLNQNTELINYEIEDEIMTLNFNNSIFTHDKILEEVTYTIKESVCSTYPVKSVILEVEGNVESTNNCN